LGKGKKKTGGNTEKGDQVRPNERTNNCVTWREAARLIGRRVAGGKKRKVEE